MNYLGHAFIASLMRSDPAFVLGAMLPDLSAMAGLRITTIDARLSPGITFHHRTDSAFHEHPVFVRGQRLLQTNLLDEGMRKGPARAIAHIGIEFLIDAAFIPSAAYLTALEFGAEDHDLWNAEGHEAAPTFGSLCERLRARLWAPHEVTENRLWERLRATLQSRPRLAPSDFELDLASRKLAEQASHWKALAPGLAEAILHKLHRSTDHGGAYGP